MMEQPGAWLSEQMVTRGEQRLLFVVEQLVALEGCPWTRNQKAEELLQHLKDECREAMQEIQRIVAPFQVHQAEALVSELGDIVFCIFMAIFLAARDFSFEPVEP